MRKCLQGLGVAAAVLLSSQAAMAEGPWYVSGSIGAYIRQDATSDNVSFWGSSGATGYGTNAKTYDPGVVVNAAVGRRVFGPFRVEGELGYANYGVGSVSPHDVTGAIRAFDGRRYNVTSGADSDRYTATVNAFYDFPMFGRLMPYAGVGVGFAHAEESSGRFVIGNSTFSASSGSDDAAIMLGEIGGAVSLNNSWAIVPSYRFEHYFYSGNSTEENAHILKLGLRYSF
jgi:opacity protein-like surface antigen